MEAETQTKSKILLDIQQTFGWKSEVFTDTITDGTASCTDNYKAIDLIIEPSFQNLNEFLNTKSRSLNGQFTLKASEMS